MVSYIQSFGIYGPIIAFLLFFVQAVAPIIPYIILAGAAGMIYGKLAGFFLAWIGALSGALFLYGLSRFIGSSFFISIINKKYKFDLDSIDDRHIFGILLISRIFPVVPTPIINIGSGLSGVSLKIFTLSSALGKLPWAFIYVALGDYFIKTQNLRCTLLLILLILAVSTFGIHYFKNRLSIRKN